MNSHLLNLVSLGITTLLSMSILMLMVLVFLRKNLVEFNKTLRKCVSGERSNADNFHVYPAHRLVYSEHDFPYFSGHSRVLFRYCGAKTWPSRYFFFCFKKIEKIRQAI